MRALSRKLLAVSDAMPRMASFSRTSASGSCSGSRMPSKRSTGATVSVSLATPRARWFGSIASGTCSKPINCSRNAAVNLPGESCDTTLICTSGIAAAARANRSVFSMAKGMAKTTCTIDGQKLARMGHEQHGSIGRNLLLRRRPQPDPIAHLKNTTSSHRQLHSRQRDRHANMPSYASPAPCSRRC